MNVAITESLASSDYLKLQEKESMKEGNLNLKEGNLNVKECLKEGLNVKECNLNVKECNLHLKECNLNVSEYNQEYIVKIIITCSILAVCAHACVRNLNI